MVISKFEVKNENGTIRGEIKEPEIETNGVLLCLHGSPNGNMQGNAGVFDQIAEKVSPVGYAVVQFSMYGSAPSDGQQKDSSIKTQLADYNAMFDFVRQRFNCPIHIVGESAGVTIAAIKWKEEPKSYILLWPAFDLKDTDLNPYLTYDWWAVVNAKGFLDDNGVIIGRELFMELLFTDFSKSFNLPAKDILLIHGQSDTEVSFLQSVKAISNANGNLRFVTEKSAGHGFKTKTERQIVLTEIEKWLTKF